LQDNGTGNPSAEQDLKTECDEIEQKIAHTLHLSVQNIQAGVGIAKKQRFADKA